MSFRGKLYFHSENYQLNAFSGAEHFGWLGKVLVK